MHRVNLKQKQARILRIVAYSVTLTLSVLTTVLLLYIALGYRFDGKSGHVVRSGLLLVNSRPESGAIYINNELKDNATPGRFVLSSGNYDLRLVREGYREWAKNVKVAASGVREVNYPLLLPTSLSATKLFDISKPDMVTQSQDRKTVLFHTPGAPSFERVKLDPESPERETLALPRAFTSESGQFGTFSVREWALDNKHLLLQHSLPSGKTELISFDELNLTNEKETVGESTATYQYSQDLLNAFDRSSVLQEKIKDEIVPGDFWSVNQKKEEEDTQTDFSLPSGWQTGELSHPTLTDIDISQVLHTPEVMSMIEKEVQKQVAQMVSEVVWKILPEVAEKVVKQEIEKITMQTLRQA